MPRTKLTVDITTTSDERLRVEYRLRNEGSSDLFVFDRLFQEEPSGARVLDDDMAYVSIEGHAILLRRAMVPIPPETKVESPVIPYASVLPAGRESHVVFHLALPLRENDPYRDVEEQTPPETGVSRTVAFGIGVLEKSSSVEAKELTDHGEGVYSLDYASAAAQSLVEAAPVPLNVEFVIPPATD